MHIQWLRIARSKVDCLTNPGGLGAINISPARNPFLPQSPFPIRGGANEGGIEQNRSPLNALVL
jgi:hypothetical protein